MKGQLLYVCEPWRCGVASTLRTLLNYLRFEPFFLRYFLLVLFPKPLFCSVFRRSLLVLFCISPLLSVFQYPTTENNKGSKARINFYLSATVAKALQVALGRVIIYAGTYEAEYNGIAVVASTYLAKGVETTIISVT
jgi:hypothetical protein